jgi:uncharacterized protein YkwD
MRFDVTSKKSVRALAVMLAAAALAGCAETAKPLGQPTFYNSMAQPDTTLDANAAASMISGYRANNGLPAVTIDPQLMQLADARARAMAARNRVDQNLGGPFRARLKQAGYDAKVAGENVSAGYHTLAEAFSGWRDSPPHQANMLLRGATKMGIAAVYAPGSKYKVFWSLILAEPGNGPG